MGRTVKGRRHLQIVGGTEHGGYLQVDKVVPGLQGDGGGICLHDLTGGVCHTGEQGQLCARGKQGLVREVIGAGILRSGSGGAGRARYAGRAGRAGASRCSGGPCGARRPGDTRCACYTRCTGGARRAGDSRCAWR